MGHRHLNVKKRFGKYLLYPASFKIIAGLLGGPEIRTPKEIIEYRFEILASHFMKTNEYFFSLNRLYRLACSSSTSS